MLLHPQVMRKAQAEVDAVVGRNRVPEFEDLDDLPYTNAVIKETYRWCPPLPMVVAHSNICDDEYEGMFIPKNSTVHANV
jgi:cytochrome P450